MPHRIYPLLKSFLRKFDAVDFISFGFAIVFSVVMIRNTYYNGWDFTIYHAAAKAFWDGQSPYKLTESGVWPFKYPPWTLPFFLPFGLVPLSTAKIFWGLLQVASLASILYWLRQSGISRRVLIFTSLCFWFLFAYHSLSGQLVLTITAICLLGGIFRERKTEDRALIVTSIALSSKVFFLYALLYRVREVFVPKVLLKLFLIILFLSLPALYQDGNELFSLWLKSMSTTDQILNDTVSRGWRNQSLSAAILRGFGITREDIFLDLALFFALGAGLGLIWQKACTHLSLTEEQKWSGWLALSVVLHPLAWFHSFVLVFPLACFALESSLDSKKTIPLVMSGVGIASICFFTIQSLGYLGHLLLKFSIKSIGTLFCLGALAISAWYKEKGSF